MIAYRISRVTPQVKLVDNIYITRRQIENNTSYTLEFYPIPLGPLVRYDVKEVIVLRLVNYFTCRPICNKLNLTIGNTIW